MMRFYYVILVAFALCFQNTLAQNPKVEMSSISEEKKALVLNFLEKSFDYCNKEHLPKRTSKNYSSRFRKFYKDEKLLEGCNWYRDRYGEIESINLIEVLNHKASQVFRYKVKRFKADWETEIRVYVNAKEKISFLNFKDYWSEVFYDRNEDPPLSKVNLDLIDKTVLTFNKNYVKSRYNICEAYAMFEANEQNSIYRNTRGGYSEFLLDKCIEVQDKNGLLTTVELVEVLTDSISRKIYRYKVQFDKLSKPAEVRVLARLNDKLSGASVIDIWYDTFYEYEKATSKSLNDLGN